MPVNDCITYAAQIVVPPLPSPLYYATNGKTAEWASSRQPKTSQLGCIMNRRHFHFLPTQALIELCMAALLIGPVSARGDEPAPKGTLSGRVVDPEGKPVADARVWIDADGGKRLVESRTGAAGRFRLGPVAPVYRHGFPMLIDVEGLARHYVGRDGITIFPGADHDLGTIALVHGRRFTGQVLDADGKPKVNTEAECSVFYNVLGHTVATLGPTWKLTTDADGRFRTPPLPVGELSVTVRVPGRQLGYASRKIAPGGKETLEPIRLQEDVPITGFVRDEHGRPVAEAEVWAYPCSPSLTATDAEGKFVLRGFGPNPRFQMHVKKEGYVIGNCGVVACEDGFKVHDVGADKPAKTMKDLSVTLQRIAWMEGRAVDADTGKPVRLENVILCNFERKPNGDIVRRG